MPKIIYQTNLDVTEEWPDNHSLVPRVGEKVESRLGLFLTVVGVAYSYEGDVRVSLNLPAQWPDMTIEGFHKWYREFRKRQYPDYIRKRLGLLTGGCNHAEDRR